MNDSLTWETVLSSESKIALKSTESTKRWYCVLCNVLSTVFLRKCDRIWKTALWPCRVSRIFVYLGVHCSSENLIHMLQRAYWAVANATQFLSSVSTVLWIFHFAGIFLDWKYHMNRLLRAFRSGPLPSRISSARTRSNFGAFLAFMHTLLLWAYWMLHPLHKVLWLSWDFCLKQQPKKKSRRQIL